MVRETHKVNADDELCFAPLAALHLCESVLVCRMPSHLRRAVAISCILLHGVGVARRGGLLVQLLLMLRGVGVAGAGVDGWRRHWRAGPALVGMRWGAEVVGAGVGVLV